MVVHRPHPETETGKSDGARHRRVPQIRRSQAMMEYKGYAAEVEFDE